ncbi:MAG: DNA polymerase III subunit delta, partial [Paracoccaceae bacterium]
GFFPGLRVVLVEEATDTTTKALTTTLTDWRPGDAQVVVTAGSLAAKSSLRKLFEAHPAAYAVGLYNDPPNRAEIDAILSQAGLTQIPPPAMDALDALSRELPPGDFRQTIEKLALYKLNDPEPLSVEQIALLAPATTEAGLDDLLHAVAEGRAADIGPLMTRLGAQGTAAVTLLIMAMRHFRTLHAAASHPQGASAGIAKARPPVFGPRRDRMARQAQGWGVARLETGLRTLMDTDLALRSAGQTAPAMALVERAFLRMALMGRR